MTKEKNKINSVNTDAQKPNELDKNESELSSMYRDLSAFSHRQIDRAWKAYAFLGTLLAVIITVGLTLFYIQFADNIASLEDRINKRTEIVSALVSKRIDDQFNKEEIKDLIYKSAVEAATKHIDPLKIKKDIQGTLDGELKAVKNSLSALRNKNKIAIEQGRELTELTQLFYYAEFNINSLKKLSNYVRDHSVNNEKNKINLILDDMASSVFNKIISQVKMSYRMVSDSNWNLQNIGPYYFGLESTKGWVLQDYIDNYKNIRDDQKIVYVYNFWINSSFDKIEKYKLLQYVLKNSLYPDVNYAVQLTLDKEAKFNSSETDILFNKEKYLNWIQSEITKYKNKE